MILDDQIPFFLNPLTLGNVVGGVVFYFLGKYMKKHPAKNINPFYGYRTPKSIKSQERWDFAQIYAAGQLVNMGVLFIIIGILCLPVGFLFSINIDILLIIMVAIVLTIVFAYIFKIEKAIRKKFG